MTMPDPELWKASIVYETPDGDRESREVEEFRDRLESFLDETKSRLGLD